MIVEKDGHNAWFDNMTSKIKYYSNPDLKWEITHSYNAELNFSLFKNKLNGSFGYYYKKTKDAFLSKTVSEINGVSNYIVNKGVVTNQGVEVTLNFVPISQEIGRDGKRGFTWRIDPQIGQVVNKLVSRAINDKTNILRDKVTYEDFLNGNVELANKPMNTFFSYKFKGLSGVDGSPIFYGMETEEKERLHAMYKNMTIDEVCMAVMTESGTRIPVLQGGISNYLGYRQFGLSFNFTYSLGNKIRLLKLCDEQNVRPMPDRNLRREFVNRWRQPGDEATTNIPGLVASASIQNGWWSQINDYKFGSHSPYAMYDYSDIRVVSGDYIKLQSLSFRYVVHDNFCKKIGLKSAYVSLTGANLFTIKSKDLKGQDVTQSGSSATVNMTVRPSYSISINLTL